ncbi:MAG: prolyl oligopeptidase family serine peptidase [Gammaproteobacteria bacterium]
MAARGYAVLSFERPLDYGVVKGARSIPELEHMNRVNWADRRSVLSSLEGGVRLIQSRGVVDSRRVGLTGFSDGAATAQFAMLNSELFAAVAISNCCDDAVGNMTLLGLKWPGPRTPWDTPSLQKMDQHSGRRIP